MCFRAVLDTNWRNYGLSQPRGSLPVGPLVVMIHMASVWVPFTSESKEAIADYDEIRKEMTLALKECGRKLGIYLRRRQRMKRESEKRSVFERYIGEVAKSAAAITGVDAQQIYDALLKQAQKKTAEADLVLDEEGKVVKDKTADASGSRLERDEDVVIVEERQLPVADNGDAASEDGDLFGGNGERAASRRRGKTSGKSRRK